VKYSPEILPRSPLAAGSSDRDGLSRAGLLIALCLVVHIWGCGAAPGDTAKSDPAVETVPLVETVHAPSPSEEAPAEDGIKLPVNGTASDSLATATAIDVVAEPAESRVSAIPVGRFILITPAGPFICAVAVGGDAGRQAERLDKLIDEAMQTAVSIGQETPTWQAAVESRPFRYGQFGNLALKTTEDHQKAIRDYDWNRDGRIDREEMRRFLTRNRRSGDGFLSVRSNDPRVGQDAIAAPTWRLIDTNGDQVISADEMHAAPGRLLSRDERDDDLLTTGEIAPSVEPLEPGRRPIELPQTALVRLLSADTKWDELPGIFRAAYPRAQKSMAVGAQRAVELLKKLDRNSDGYLSEEERQSFFTDEPHLQIEARFGAQGTKCVDQPPLSVMPAVSADVWTSVQTDAVGARVSLETIGLTLEWSLSPASATVGDTEMTAQSQLSSYDKDSNGYLDRQEGIAAEQAIGPFDGLDANEDDKVFPEELATYLARQRTAALSQVQVNVARAADPVFAALDSDHDGQLGAREIDGATRRFATFDANGDGFLAPDEIPDRMMIEVSRGAPISDMMAEAQRTAPATTLRRQGPTWFQRMDANGDGDVSRREFLGSDERFVELDNDHDGFIDAHEAGRTMPPTGKGE
jgi:Ca2+-binding EF-hand superfamily protein